MRGLGTTIGMTIILALVLAIVSNLLFSMVKLPVIGLYIAKLVAIVDVYLKQGAVVR